MVVITCQYPFPDPEYQDEQFRTYDLGPYDACYGITAEGRLLWQDIDVARWTRERETLKPANTEDMDFDGRFTFELYTGGNGPIKYSARFVHGTLQEIKRLPPIIEDHDDEIWPGLADAADDVDRGYLIRHRRLLRHLEALEPTFTTRALDVWDDDRTALAYWMATPHPMLDDITPYRALALGQHEAVLEILHKMFYGFTA